MQKELNDYLITVQFHVVSDSAKSAVNALTRELAYGSDDQYGPYTTSLSDAFSGIVGVRDDRKLVEPVTSFHVGDLVAVVCKDGSVEKGILTRVERGIPKAISVDIDGAFQRAKPLQSGVMVTKL